MSIKANRFASLHARATRAGITVYNGLLNHRDIVPPDEAKDIANRLTTAFNEFKARNDGRISQLESALDKVLKDVGRMIIGGSGPAPAGNAGSASAYEAFNALQRERHGPAAPQLSYGEYREYVAAVSTYFRLGQAAQDRHDIQAAMSVGADPAGGYVVMPDADPMPRERLYRTSPMRAVASVLTITAGEYQGVHETTDSGYEWVGESTTRSETDSGALATFTIPAEEISAVVPVTQRLLDDAAIDLGSYVESRISKRFTRGENAAFVTGNGILKPRGFLDYKTTAVTTADATRPWGKLQYIPTGASGAFPTLSGSTASDPSALYDVKAALNAELRAEAVWAMNSATFALIEKLRDANGLPLIRQSLDAATPERLLGYPVVIMEDMPDPASDSFSVAFGNFQVAYQIVEKPGVRMLRDPYTTKGRVKFYGYKRVGGDVVNFDAIKLLKFASS